jgi:hypothetical protein
LTTANALNPANSLHAGANFGFNPGGPAGTNFQFSVVAGFSETLTSQVFGNSGTGVPGQDKQVTTTLGLDSSAGATNFFRIYANTPGTANYANGTGFGASGTLILAGTILGTGFSSQFNELGSGTTLANFVAATDTFDKNAPANGDTTFQAMRSVIGNGSTNLTVQVNVSFTDPNFFPDANNRPFQLAFQTTSSLPFGSIVPSQNFFNGAATFAAVIGSGPVTAQTGTNGQTGPDFMFQADASNSFAVPEPGSITMAVTALGLVSLVGGVRVHRRRRNNTSAVA